MILAELSIAEFKTRARVTRLREEEEEGEQRLTEDKVRTVKNKRRIMPVINIHNEEVYDSFTMEGECRSMLAC